MSYFFYCLSIISVGIFFDTMHSLYYYKQYYSKTGLFNLQLMFNRKEKGVFIKTVSFLNPLLEDKPFFYILVVRLLLSMLLIIFPSIFYPIIFVIFLIQLLFNIRNKLALSGADQMRTIILFGLSIMSLKSPSFFAVGILFIISQLYISYFFTGYNKLKSVLWRRGSALIWVLNSSLFGNDIIQKRLIRMGKNINRILCWGIILFQLLFPIFASNSVTVLYILAVGFLFHLSLAIISNLNDFFWTYASTYPLVYYFATEFKFYDSFSY